MARPDNSKTNLPIIVSTPWNKTSWKTLKLNVLCSDRSDLEVGQGFLSRDASGRNVVSYNFRDPKWATRDSLITKPFLNGFDVGATTNHVPIGVKLDSPSYNSTTASCYASSFNQAKLMNVFAYFVIFDPKNVNFLFSEGYIQQNMLAAVIKIEVPTKHIKTFDTYVAGISSFNFDTTSAISFTSTLDNKFVLQLGPIISSTINFIGYHYLIIGYGECSRCGESPILYKNTCVDKCPFGTVMKGGECVDVFCPSNSVWDGTNCVCSAGFNNLNGICIRCTGELVFDSSRGCVCKVGLLRIKDVCGTCPVGTVYDGVNNCICPPGSIDRNGQCVVCPAGTLPQNNRCVCDTAKGYFEINGECQTCPADTQYDTYLGKCIPQCAANSYFNGTNCVCNPGYFVINGVCDFCKPGTIFNSTQGKCINACDSTEIWDGVQCQCKAGLYRIQGVCDSCQANSRWNGTGCQCLEGFYPINCKCVACPAPRTWNTLTQSCDAPSLCGANERIVAGLCVCLEGYLRIQGRCMIAGTQGGIWPSHSACQDSNAVFISTGCFCKAGYFVSKGVCTAGNGNGAIVPVSCASGYNLTDNLCSNGNNNVNSAQQVCADPNAFFVGGICVCKPGFTYKNSQCATNANPVIPTCAYNSYWDGEKCVCNFGYTLRNGVCISNTPNNCATGFTLKDGVCVPTASPSQCNNGMIWSGVSCTCPPGCTFLNGACTPVACKNGNVANGVCVCNPGSVLLNGECINPSTCPTMAYWNGQTCVCSTGSYFVNGTCLPVPEVGCGPNSFFNGVQCMCAPGYFKGANNLCQAPPAGTYWNGQACVPLTANPTCVGGTTWNGVYCAAENSTSCGANGYWNGISCVCNPNSYLVNGYCTTCQRGSYYNGYQCAPSVPGVVQCPSAQFFNGVSCVCVPGTFNINGNCVRCPVGTTWMGSSCVQNEVLQQIPKCRMGEQFIFNRCICLPGLFKKASSCSISL